MGASVTALPNSKAKLQERFQAGRITWTWPRLGFLRFIPYSGIRWGEDYRAIELRWCPAPATMMPLRLWGALFSVLALPIIWGIAAEMTHQGCSLPRLQVLSGRGWLSFYL